MPNFCAVIGCSNHAVKGGGKSFYRIPSIVTHQGEQTRLLTLKRREGWLQALKRKNLNLKHGNDQYKYDQYRICSDHFITGVPSTLYDVSNPDWIPSVNMGHQCVTAAGREGSQQHERRKKGAKRKIEDDESVSHDELPETTRGCEEQDQSLVGQLHVKVETEEIQIQHSQQAAASFAEIQQVIIKEETIKEEPDVSSFFTTSNTHGITEQTIPSPGQMEKEIEDSSLKLCEDVETFVVRQQEMFEEMYVSIREEDTVSESFRSLESSDIEDSEIDYEAAQLLDTDVTNIKRSKGAITIVPVDLQESDMENRSNSDDDNLSSASIEEDLEDDFLHEQQNDDTFTTTESPKKKRLKGQNNIVTISMHAQEERFNTPASLFESWKKIDIKPFQPPDPVFPAPKCLKTPHQYFNMLFTDEMIAHIAEQTNLYSYQQTGSSINTTFGEIEIFLSMLLYMGVFDFPSFEDYWNPESLFPPVADVMSARRFHSLRRYLHFSDNTHCHLSSDSLYKIRPLFNMLRQQCLLIPPDNRQNIAAAVMVGSAGANTGNHGQNLNKQEKSGFKLFFRSSYSGIVHDLLLYYGDSGCTKGEQDSFGDRVVTTLCRTIPQPESTVVFCDNYLINFNLIKSLEKELGVRCLGPVRAVVDEKDHAKQGFGEYSYVSQEGVIAVKWTEKKSITVLSNSYGVEPLGSVSRSCIEDKKEKVDIPCPSVILACNQAKGGISLSQNVVNLYKTQMKSGTWYHPLFGYILDLCIANSWLVYRRDCDFLKVKAMSLKRFRLSVAATLKAVNNVSVRSAQPPVYPTSLKQTHSVPQPSADVRYDGIGHWPVYGKQRGRCSLCAKGVSWWKCSKCGDGKLFLCLNSKQQCFVSYHQQK